MSEIRSDTRRLLGDDLATLVGLVDADLRSASPITRLPAAADRRATYRLEFADGRIFKGRRVPTPADAERIESINRRLDPRYFTRVVDRMGPALLESWVDGTSLFAEDVTDDLMTHCGRILAAVHAADAPGLPHGSDVIARHQVRMDQQLNRFAADGLLSRSTAEKLLQSIRSARPDGAAVGVIHHDYCAENLVLRAPMQPVNVDNGSFRIGALDEDLARTWYRWPVAGSAFDAFLDGYRRASARRLEPDAMPFWRIAAVAGSATDRLRAQSDRVRFPLAVLELLADGADGEIDSLAPLDTGQADE